MDIEKRILPLIPKYRNTGLSDEVIAKLITFIDLRKVEGQLKSYASSKFGDYLGFLQIPETEATFSMFDDRWKDSRIRIKIPKEYEKYVASDHPMFTAPRLEPSIDNRPFYKQGIQPSMNPCAYDSKRGGNIKVPQELLDDYSNFLIEDNIPEVFYMMIRNNQVESVLKNGLPETDYDDPYVLSDSADSAKSIFLSYFKAGENKVLALKSGTLLKINSDFLEKNNDVFYTQKFGMHRMHRMHGYFYTGEILAKALSV
jgi:hypothetical protein